MEVGVFTDSTGEQSCVSLWNLSNGVLLKSFKNGACAKNGVSFVGDDYVIAAQHQKQLLHIYDTHKEQLVKKIVCPGKITAMAVSPDGKYCVVALVERVYVWQLCTGDLMAILSKHYQAVTCIRFVQDGSFFMTAGDDNLLLVWKFANVLQPKDPMSNHNVCEHPFHTLSHHSMPVKSIYVGVGGMRCRIATCSLDQTCKLFDLISGKMLCSFVFNVGCSAVTMDMPESRLFAGTMDGRIYIVNLYDKKAKETHVSSESIIKAHTKEVTSLSVCMDGTKMLSGSLDASVKLWHINSQQCLRTFSFKGEVTNAFVKPYPAFLQDRAVAPIKCGIENFKRTTTVRGGDTCSWSTMSDENTIPVVLKDIREDEETHASWYLEQALLECSYQESSSTRNTLKTATRSELLQRISALESMAQEFYTYAGEKLIKDATSTEQSTGQT